MHLINKEKIISVKILEMNNDINIINIYLSSKINKNLLIKYLLDYGYKYINLRERDKAKLANEMPVIFCLKYNGALILDNLQYGIYLLPVIKEFILRKDNENRIILISDYILNEKINYFFSDMSNKYKNFNM